MRYKQMGDELSCYYLCYIINGDGKEIKIAKIYKPHDERLNGYSCYWRIKFIAGRADGQVGGLQMIMSRIKTLSQRYKR